MGKIVLLMALLLVPMTANAWLNEVYCEQMYRDPATSQIVNGARVQLSLRPDSSDFDLTFETLAPDHSVQHTYKKSSYRCAQTWDFQKEGKAFIDCRFTPAFPQSSEHFTFGFPSIEGPYAKLTILQRDDAELCDDCDGSRPYIVVRKFDMSSCNWK